MIRPPKIFLVCWSHDILVKTAQELDRKKIVDIVYWNLSWVMPAVKKLNRNDFPKTIFHETLEAVKGIPADKIDVSQFEPVSADLILKLHICESIVLSMMDRMDYSQTLSRKRKHLYYQYLKYWSNVLKSLKPDLIIFSTYPHMMFDFVLYSLAKLYGIKTLMFDAASLPNRLLVVDDIEKNSLMPYFKLFFDNQKQAKEEDLSEDLRAYYYKMIDKKNTYLYYHPNFLDNRRTSAYLPYQPNIKNIVKKLKKGRILSVFKAVLSYLKKIKNLFLQKSYLSSFDDDFVGLEYVRQFRKWVKLKKQFKKEYLGLQANPDFERDFVFAPLACQPEMSSNPMGGVFNDQLLLIDILAKAIPKNWLLYVKEHPAQVAGTGVHSHQGRYKGYYQKIAQYSNVRLAPIGASMNQLLLKSKAVAVISGTTGWNALFKEKPVLLFGYPIYRFCPGVFEISDIKTCQQAIEAIIQGQKPDKQKALNFLAALDKISIKAYLAQYYQKEKGVSEKECLENIQRAIINELPRV